MKRVKNVLYTPKMVRQTGPPAIRTNRTFRGIPPLLCRTNQDKWYNLTLFYALRKYNVGTFKSGQMGQMCRTLYLHWQVQMGHMGRTCVRSVTHCVNANVGVLPCIVWTFEHWAVIRVVRIELIRDGLFRD